ncbi:hypothetical protein HPB49_017711 [Dermacentor silvarum]|uniref:Uncharacterized protein n=1 Tax=Dermacentor silvarum TaxID=543639 RepID=A0ACB8CGG8_DERSI|nr:hypothetical protein HPB49_017711 [Dermacentor silvarum]
MNQYRFMFGHVHVCGKRPALQIAERIPLVDTKQDLSILEKEYALDDEVYQQKVKDLRSKYQSIRKTRPDGNCFFRAFSFAYLESLLSDQQEYTSPLSCRYQVKQ